MSRTVINYSFVNIFHIYDILKVEGLLRAILRDEMIAWHKKKQDDVSQPSAQVAPNSTPPDIAR